MASLEDIVEVPGMLFLLSLVLSSHVTISSSRSGRASSFIHDATEGAGGTPYEKAEASK